MAGGVLFGSQAWDPVHIVAQIVSIQCMFYMSLGLLSWMLVGPYVPNVALYQLFDWRWTSFSTFQGLMVVTATVLNSLAAGAYLRLVVKRAKKCLDFSATCYLIHLAVVASYSGLPAQASWWVTTGVSLASTAVLGEWLCMRLELAEIPLASLGRSRPGSRAALQTAGGVAELTTVTLR